MYKTEEYTLRFPLFFEEQKISKLKIELLTHEQHAAIIKNDPKEIEAFPKFIAAATGLTEQQVKKIKAPDYNSLTLKLSDIVSKSTSFFMPESITDGNDLDNFKLLKPIVCSDGVTRDSLKIEMPDIGAIQIMHKQDDDKKAHFISAQCTGLAESDLNALSVPDFNQLQERINDFFTQTADYFQ